MMIPGAGVLRRAIHNKMVQNNGIPILSSKTSWLSLLAVDILQNVVFLFLWKQEFGCRSVVKLRWMV